MNIPVQVSDLQNVDDCIAQSGLLSPSIARTLLLKDVTAVDGEEVLPLMQLAGRVTTANLHSAVALPRFDNAAVDGYGIHAKNLAGSPAAALRVLGPVLAGHQTTVEAMPGSAVRILTGASIPTGVAAVILEEHAQPTGDFVVMHFAPTVGANIRRRGEDVSKGTEVVQKGTRLDARHIAMLAATGISSVSVRRPLRIGVLSTGDELVDAGNEPTEARIVDTNRPMLLSLLSSPAVELVDLGIVADHEQDVSTAMAQAATRFDLLITSGGVAGSDADHLARAIIAAGGRCRTLKLALRPGKPIAAGMLGRLRILCLPGNPVAAMVNLLLFGRPLIQRMLGMTETLGMSVPSRAAAVFHHRRGRTEFLPAKVTGFAPDGIPLLEKLGRGGSARLLPLIAADGLVEIGPHVDDVPPDAALAFHPFAASFAL
jgi:molybdopterin molybdotransferase